MAIVGGGVIVLAIMLMVIMILPDTEPAPPNKDISSRSTMTTPNGTFTVPGTGYMDGRDLEASPPLTLMSISVRERITGPRPAPVVCKLRHGTSVNVIDVQQDPERKDPFYKFKVQNGSCTGWVSWWFVNTQQYAPIGDEIY